MIPKIIHYCWFGGNPLPELARKCILSWEKYFPDYEIKEWNESNYDVHKIPYISEAYNAKKYAFVSDYARFDILYNYGGIYFDTDVEVIKPFDDILNNGGFMGFENDIGVASGLGMGCNAGLGIVDQILNFYSKIYFINKDGTYNFCTVVAYVTAILAKNGLKIKNIIQYLDGLTIYPIEYFNPIDYDTHFLKITNNTYSIHHGVASWVSERDKKQSSLHITLCRIFGKKLGRNIAYLCNGFILIPEKGIYWFLKGCIKRMLKIKRGLY
jgi:mannosyltransferase OCH1-like enzyme